MPNKYARTPDATLDLHQHTREEAKEAVNAFLHEAETAGHSLVRIITGKGVHSNDGPVLGYVVRCMLREYGYAFSDAKVNEGGEGAIDVKL